MFKNFLRNLHDKSETPSLAPVVQPPVVVTEATLRRIVEQREIDPLIGARLGSKEIAQLLLNLMRTEHGVHAYSLLTALGSLAGYACQAAVREEEVVLKAQMEEQVFTIIKGADGRNYCFGDALHGPLFEDTYSVWTLVAATVKELGGTLYPDVREIAEYVAQTVGDRSFGVPRTPDGHAAADLPENYVTYLWPDLLPLLRKFCQWPSEWPILLGMATQEVMRLTRTIMHPEIAAAVVLEAAIPMSKVELIIPLVGESVLTAMPPRQ